MTARNQNAGRLQKIFEITTGVALLAAAIVMFVLGLTILRVVNSGIGQVKGAGTSEAEPIPTEPIDTETSPILGSSDARVVLVEFSDFQCPVCARFSRSALQTLKANYIATGKLALAFRHFPLDSIHPLASGAAEASECAGAQGQFWPMHDALFSLNGRLERSSLRNAAQTLGLDSSAFEACMTGATKKEIDRDLAVGRALELRGTPSFFLGVGKPGSKVRITAKFTGIPKPEVLSKAIDSALTQSVALRAANQRD